MNLSALFARIQGKKREFVMGFHDLVRLVGDDKAPEPESIARALQDAGKTVDDLQQAVELLQRRRQWRQVMTHVESLETERADIRKQIDTANRELAEAEQRHTDTVWPLEGRLLQIAQATRDAEDARRQLWNTCANPELIDALAELNSEVSVLATRRNQLSQERDALMRRGQADLEEAAHARSEADAQALRNRSQHQKAQAKQFDAELTKLDKKLAKLQQREQEIRQQMLDP